MTENKEQKQITNGENEKKEQTNQNEASRKVPGNEKGRVVKRAVRQSVQSKKVKQGSSIGGKGIIIGIVAFVVIIVLMVFFFFFYLTANPNIAKSIGMGANTVKQITGVFAGLLFGGLFIVFLFMGLSYIYKLITRTSSKSKNIIGVVIVFILGVANISLGWIVFARINAIQVEDVIDTQNVIISNIHFSDPSDTSKEKIVPSYTNNYPIVAPVAISFDLNSRVFNSSYLPQIKAQAGGNISISKFTMDCGNGSVITYNNNLPFPQNNYCLYMKKGEYKTKFSLTYNTNTKTNQVYNMPGEIINIQSEVGFLSNSKLNDNKTEIIAGERTDQVRIDLRKIPNDLGLSKNDIDIDFEGKGEFMNKKGIVQYVYKNDGLYNMTLKLPNMDGYPYYSIPIRISPSTKPTCTITQKEQNGLYFFSVEGNSPNGSIRQYNYIVNNTTKGTKEKNGQGKELKIALSNGSDYQVEWNIVDSKGDVGKCLSNTVELSSKKSYTYKINVFDKNEKEIKYENDTIVVNILPSTYKLEIADVEPKEEVTYGFDVDGDGKIDQKTQYINVKISKKGEQSINTFVTDIYGNRATKTINFVVEQKPVIAVLTSDKYKGEAPLKVIFDASTSEVTDDGDKIVYFDWHFGDGDKVEQTRQGSVEHVYDKPGTYKTRVIVETEKGQKDEAIKKIFVLRQVNIANIVFPENLGGQVKKGDALKIDLETDGLIKNVERDFGDSGNLKCTGRECMSVNHTYNKKGIYNISARVEYTDGSPSVVGHGSINVIE